MLIREGTPNDIEALIALDEVALHDRSRGDYIAQAVKSGGLFVAEWDGKPVGYGVLAYSFYGNGMIELVYVAKGYRRVGVGRALVRYAESCCHTPKLFTSTNLTNKPMQLLLEGLGYRLTGLIDNLDPGDPELVYFRQLGDRRK